MVLHLFDLNLLVALDALLTERHVTRAGNRLNLSQSAMIGALARLRHTFGDDLLVPVGRQMVLTAGRRGARRADPRHPAADSRHARLEAGSSPRPPRPGICRSRRATT